MQFNNDQDKTQLTCETKLVFEQYVTIWSQRLCSQASIKFHEPQCERKAKAEEERRQRCHNHHHNHQKREIVFTLRPYFWFIVLSVVEKMPKVESFFVKVNHSDIYSFKRVWLQIPGMGLPCHRYPNHQQYGSHCGLSDKRRPRQQRRSLFLTWIT